MLLRALTISDSYSDCSVPYSFGDVYELNATTTCSFIVRSINVKLNQIFKLAVQIP